MNNAHSHAVPVNRCAHIVRRFDADSSELVEVLADGHAVDVPEPREARSALIGVFSAAIGFLAGFASALAAGAIR